MAMSLNVMNEAAEYVDARTLDLDRMADVLREVLAGEPKACLSEILHRQIARSAAMESATDTAIEGDQGEDRLAPQAAVEEV
jgi:hypothetical protein